MMRFQSAVLSILVAIVSWRLGHAYPEFAWFSGWMGGAIYCIMRDYRP